jgi:hypothetical protein
MNALWCECNSWGYKSVTDSNMFHSWEWVLQSIVHKYNSWRWMRYDVIATVGGDKCNREQHMQQWRMNALWCEFNSLGTSVTLSNKWNSWEWVRQSIIHQYKSWGWMRNDLNATVGGTSVTESHMFYSWGWVGQSVILKSNSWGWVGQLAALVHEWVRQLAILYCIPKCNSWQQV